jgi:hypothetical protein
VQARLTRAAVKLVTGSGGGGVARGHFRQLLSLGDGGREPDSSLLAEYSDFLLDRGRATEVVKCGGQVISDTTIGSRAAIFRS